MEKKSGADRSNKRVDCFSCVYHQITWEPAHPYGCRAMGFKSKIMPSLEVFRSSGIPCQRYSPKPGRG